MELRYPIVFVIGLFILLIVIFFIKRKKEKYGTGRKIANTQYIKKTAYYQRKIKQYHGIILTIKALTLCSILLTLFLIARPTKVSEYTPEQYNRDIILCMDVSQSVNELNYEIVDTVRSTVDSLHGERFGITTFNSSASSIVPLTDDYHYVLTNLDRLKKSLEIVNTGNRDYKDEYGDYYDYVAFLDSGTLEGDSSRGSSLIGDGLASCVYSFPKLEEDRTRIIIFSTDNELAGTPLVSLEEAAKIASQYNIVVYGIETNNISDRDHNTFQNAMNITGGKLYQTKSETTQDIVAEIEKLSKSKIVGKKEIIKTDMPTIPFILLGICISITIFLRKLVIS